MNSRAYMIAWLLLAPSLVRLNGATFFGPTPYLSSADIPAGLYVSGAPTVLEDFEHGNLNPSIIASSGRVVPPGGEGLIDSVDADDGVIDGSGLNGHSWFTDDASSGVKFTFPPGTTAAGLVWTDGNDGIIFSAFGPGNVPLGVIGPLNGIADGRNDGTTAEDRFFGVRNADGVESIFITSGSGGLEVDHVQYELGSAQSFAIDWHSIAASGTSIGGDFSLSGSIGQPATGIAMSGDDYTVESGFWSIGVGGGPAAAGFNRNLILNPSAEAGAGSVSANDILPVPNWTTASNFTVVVYNSALQSPGPGFGTNYFAGGPATRTDAINPFSSATQMIDVSARASEIDTARVIAELSGYFGGFGDQNDRASLTATYLDASGNGLGSNLVGNVLGVDRTNRTALLFRGGTNSVPVGTRKIQVVLSMINDGGAYYNDGYADNLSLVLRHENVSAATLVVPGTANPWLAGMTNGFHEAYGDVTPDESPVLLTNFTAGARLQFTASGSASYGAAASGPAGIGGSFVSHAAQDGIGAIANSLVNALIGVFLDDAQPDSSAATPGPLDFGSTDSQNYLVLQPALKQPFYIGSGTNASGLRQSVIAPVNATRLFLGIQDGVGWYNNTGSFTVVASGPEPGTGNASTVIFDNTSGSDNGGIGFTDTTWLASKFCLGSQSYSLDSVSMFLSSQDFSGHAGPPSSVRLQLYANDPVTGKPSASIAVMNLAGLTNPITPPNGYGLVKWIPATPLHLSTNTCYWAVVSREGGGAIGEIASFSTPTGAAAGLGKAQSNDSGATWGVDPSFNFKMLIWGTPISISVTTPDLAAGGSTAIPGGSGAFTSFPYAPSLSGDDAAFLGLGSGDQQGIYVRNRYTGVARIADLNTPIPNGTGNFLSYGTQAGIIIVGGTQAGIIIVGGNVLFTGRGSGGQQGIYFADHSNPTEPIRIVDTSTPIPGDIGNFTAFQDGLGFDGANVAFVASGSGGQQGIYEAISPPQVGSPFRIADSSTAIPDGSGNFTAFPSAPALSGSEVAFIGNGSAGQQGLYKVAAISPPQVGSPLKIADTTTAIPNGIGNFTSFGSDQAHPIDPTMSGDRLAFVGSGSGGQQGVYSADTSTPGNPVRIADTAMAIPGGSGNFASFSAVSVSDTDVAFLANGSEGQQGIYAATSQSTPVKVIDLHDKIGGKAIAKLNFSRAGLFGDPITFQATFTDGSQGVYTMDIVPPPPVLQIIGVEIVGNDLRLSFASEAGKTYAIQSSDVLTTGEWPTIPGDAITGTGATVQATVPNAFAQPQQFYRLKELP